MNATMKLALLFAILVGVFGVVVSCYLTGTYGLFSMFVNSVMLGANTRALLVS